jgi:nucleoside 2-deoxyribosyltransferase
MEGRYVIYLAGPITGLSFDNAVDWRDEFNKLLPPEIQGMSPLRGKTYLQNETEIAASYEDNVLSCARGIITRDYNDCRRCDILVANFLGAKKVSIGSVMEIAWAKAFQTPVIMIMEETGNPHDHPMVTECVGFRVTSVEQAASIATVLLLPAPHRKS